MKKATAKVLLTLGIVLFIGGFFLTSISNKIASGSNLAKIIFFMTLSIILGLIFLVVAWIGWNSEERKVKKELIFNAQMAALKKGKVNIQLNSKMRKLK